MLVRSIKQLLEVFFCIFFSQNDIVPFSRIQRHPSFTRCDMALQTKRELQQSFAMTPSFLVHLCYPLMRILHFSVKDLNLLHRPSECLRFLEFEFPLSLLASYCIVRQSTLGPCRSSNIQHRCHKLRSKNNDVLGCLTSSVWETDITLTINHPHR